MIFPVITVIECEDIEETVQGCSCISELGGGSDLWTDWLRVSAGANAFACAGCA